MFSRWMLTIVLAGAAMAQTPSPARSYSISGTVVNALSGQPLAHTQVAIGLAQQSDVADSFLTGEDGHFLFKDVAPGKYWLVAERNGYPRQAFEEHNQYSTAIVTGPDLVSDNLIFRLQPDASISGRITDDQNDPIRAAQVMLFHSGAENGRQTILRRGQTSTDDQGQYRFSHLPPGEYYIVVSARPWYAAEFQQQHPGAQDERSPLDAAYPITYYPGSIDENGASPISVKSGDRATADVSLIPVPALHVRVPAGGDAENVGSVQMMARVFNRFNVPAEFVTSNDGSGYAVNGLAPGRYVMQTESYGKKASATRQEVNVADDVEIAPSGEGINFELSGRVRVDGDVEPPAGAFVRFINRTTGDSFGAAVTKKGDFEVSRNALAAGKYEVYVFNLGKGVVRNILATGAKSSGRTVELTGKGPVQLTIEVSRGLGQIDGTAMRDGKPLAGAMIVLLPKNTEDNAPLVRRDQSDSDGTFTLHDVLPGEYTVLALARGWELEWLNPSVLKPYLQHGNAVEVMPLGKYNVKVDVQ